MKKLKQKMKNWIVNLISDTYPKVKTHEDVKTEFNEWFKQAKQDVEKHIFKLDWFMNEYHTTICSQCEKNILAHYGGFYKNFEGKVFCSNECIDKNKKDAK